MNKPVGRMWQWIDTTVGCWLWTGALQNKNSGYGVINIAGRKEYAHRLIWMLLNGPIPDGKLICHHCDEPRCVRPSHLYAGTQKQNVADMFRRGRANTARGERSGSSKLTAEVVLQIRRIYSGGGVSQRAVAKMFDIGKSQVNCIVNRTYWRHV